MLSVVAISWPARRRRGRTPVVVGQIPHQIGVGVRAGAGSAELVAQRRRGGDMGRVGDGHLPRPAATVLGDQPAVEPDRTCSRSPITSTIRPIAVGSTE